MSAPTSSSGSSAANSPSGLSLDEIEHTLTVLRAKRDGDSPAEGWERAARLLAREFPSVTGRNYWQAPPTAEGGWNLVTRRIINEALGGIDNALDHLETIEDRLRQQLDDEAARATEEAAAAAIERGGIYDATTATARRLQRILVEARKEYRELRARSNREIGRTGWDAAIEAVDEFIAQLPSPPANEES